MSEARKKVRSLFGLIAVFLFSALLHCGHGLRYQAPNGGSGTGTGGSTLAFQQVSPGAGARGLAITITGSGFVAGASVTLGGTACSNVNVVSSSQITCTVPAHAPGPADVVITNPGGPSVTGAGAYTCLSFLFAAIGSGTPNLQVYSVDATSGGLTALTSKFIKAGTDTDAIAIHPSGKYLFVTSATDKTVSAYSIDPTNGALSLVSPTIGSATAATGSGPDFMGIDPLGSFLYVTDSTGGKLYGYIVHAGGGMAPMGSSPFAVLSTGNAAGPVIDPLSKYLYVGADVFSMATSGAPTAFPGNPYPTNTGSVQAPGTAIAPNGKTVYLTVCNGLSCGIEAHQVRADGSLPSSAPPSLTFGGAGSIPVPVTVTPSGRFVYVAGGDNNIWGYSAATDGSLSAMGSGPWPVSGGGPNATDSMAVDFSGTHLYYIGKGVIGAYVIDPTGARNGVAGSLFSFTGNTVSVTGKSIALE